MVTAASGTLSVVNAAREAPDAPALVTPDETLSYRALAGRVAVACERLRDMGLGAGDRVAIQASNRVETVAALLAFIEMGVTAVLLHPKLTEVELAALVDDASPRLVLREGDVAWTSPPPPPLPVRRGGADPGLHSALTPPSPDRERGVGGLRSEGRGADPMPHSPPSPLAILYTSGTTGRPKGAMLARSAFEASARASERNLGWRDDDRWILCLPVCHVGGLSVLTRCLMSRKAVVLLPRFDPRAVLDAVVKERGTMLSVVPTMLRALLDVDHEGVLARLRVVLSGGAGTPRSLLEACVARRVRVLTTYGLTEACSQVTTQRYDAVDRFEVRDDSGVALGGVSLRIVDETGEDAPAGAVGRIQVRGPSVMRGYWGHPPRGDAWLDTGDLGALDDEGRLRVHARRTDLIVTGGENVYPAEVEQALESLHGVKAALVFGVADETWGQLVAAALVRDPDARDDEDAWLRACAEALPRRLAKHKWPRRVCVVGELPMRASGKVDRATAVATFTPRVRPWP